MRPAVIALLLVATPAGAATAVPEPAAGPPPITVRIESPRDFGYHIGDVIPLTVAVDAPPDVVLDLENLPRPGDGLGPFEVRRVRVDRGLERAGARYRIRLELQTFVAGHAGILAVPPFELRYARSEERSADGTHVFETLMLPGQVLSLSPTVTSPREPRPDKAAVVPPPGAVFWTTVIIGAACLAAGGTGGIAALVAWRRRHAARAGPSRAQHRALRTLGLLRDRYLGDPEKAPVLAARVSAVVRRFLEATRGVPARRLTTAELIAQLDGGPDHEALDAVLQRCNRVVYGGYRPTRQEQKRLLREAASLIAGGRSNTFGERGASR
jgi:hypothetical protein